VTPIADCRLPIADCRLTDFAACLSAQAFFEARILLKASFNAAAASIGNALFPSIPKGMFRLRGMIHPSPFEP
jgi:hypothetical protein